MAKQGGALPQKRVWRISAEAPQGQYIDSGFHDSRPPTIVDAPPPEAGWLQSSLDLAEGLDVIDRTVSSELFGEWFGR